MCVTNLLAGLMKRAVFEAAWRNSCMLPLGCGDVIVDGSRSRGMLCSWWIRPLRFSHFDNLSGTIAAMLRLWKKPGMFIFSAWSAERWSSRNWDLTGPLRASPFFTMKIIQSVSTFALTNLFQFLMKTQVTWVYSFYQERPKKAPLVFSEPVSCVH